MRHRVGLMRPPRKNKGSHPWDNDLSAESLLSWCRVQSTWSDVAPGAVAQVLVALTADTVEEARQALRNAQHKGVEPVAWAAWAALANAPIAMDALMAEGYPVESWRVGAHGHPVATHVVDEGLLDAATALVARGLSPWQSLLPDQPSYGEGDAGVSWLSYAISQGGSNIAMLLMTHAQASLPALDPTVRQDVLDRALREVACHWPFMKDPRERLSSSPSPGNPADSAPLSKIWGEQLMEWGANPYRQWTLSGNEHKVPWGAPPCLGATQADLHTTTAHLWARHRRDWPAEWNHKDRQPWPRDSYLRSPFEAAVMDGGHPAAGVHRAPCEAAQEPWDWVGYSLTKLCDDLKGRNCYVDVTKVWQKWKYEATWLAWHGRPRSEADHAEARMAMQPTFPGDAPSPHPMQWHSWVRFVDKMVPSFPATHDMSEVNNGLRNIRAHLLPYLSPADQVAADNLLNDLYKLLTGPESQDAQHREKWKLLLSVAHVAATPPSAVRAKVRL